MVYEEKVLHYLQYCIYSIILIMVYVVSEEYNAVSEMWFPQYGN